MAASSYTTRSIDNKEAFIQAMAWHWEGDKPLSEPILTQFTDACICGTGLDELLIEFKACSLSEAQL